MLTDTSPCSGAKSSEYISWDIITLILPSLWPKNKWILEIFLRIVISHMLDSDTGSFFNLYTVFKRLKIISFCLEDLKIDS